MIPDEAEAKTTTVTIIKNMKISLHFLQTMHSCNPNRGSGNQAKITSLGGVDRAYVSSQATNRPRREKMIESEELKGWMGTRTRNTPQEVQETLIKVGIPENDAKAISLWVRKAFAPKKQDGKGTAQALFHVVKPFCDYVAGQVLKIKKNFPENYDSLIDKDLLAKVLIEMAIEQIYSDTEDKRAKQINKDYLSFIAFQKIEKTDENGILNAVKSWSEMDEDSWKIFTKESKTKTTKENKASSDSIIKLLFPDIRGIDRPWDTIGVDIQFFGRMGQSALLPTVNGGLSTAPAISVGAVKPITETFSVKEEMPQHQGHDGAAHIGERNLVSGTFYNFSGIDVGLLSKTIPLDLLKIAIKNYIESVLECHPKSMDRATGNSPTPGYLLVCVGPKAAYSLAGAYITPIVPDIERNEGELDVAVKKLVNEANSYYKFMGEPKLLAYDPKGLTPADKNVIIYGKDKTVDEFVESIINWAF